MNKPLIVTLGILGVLVFSFFIIVGMFISTSNTESRLRTTIENKLKDNTSEFDNMYKKISQVAQVSEKQMSYLKDIIISHAEARTGTGDGGSIMKWIQESVPNIDTSTMNNLQNIITSSRDSWTMRQKELIDLSREHTTMLRVFPSNVILSFLGRKEIPITIITSSRTENVFKTGKDDEIKVFSKE